MAWHRSVVTLLLLSVAPASLMAQQPLKFTVSGFGGLFFPTADLIDFVEEGVLFKLGQETGWTLGGRAALWPSAKLGVEAEAIYASSDGKLSAAGLPGVETGEATVSGSALLVSLNALYVFFDPPFEPFAMHVSGGLGWVSRGGDLGDLEGVSDVKNDIAAVIGLGLRYGLSPTVDIRLDLKDYISSFDWDQPGVDAQLQNDVMVLAGVQLTLGGN